MTQEDHWLAGFNFNIEEWDAKGQTYDTLAICRTLAVELRTLLLRLCLFIYKIVTVQQQSADFPHRENFALV